jgi:hypothetical protein
MGGSPHIGTCPAYGNVETGERRESRVSERVDATVGVAERESRVTSVEIEIEVQGRWDALALSEMLIPYHSFLVQFDRQRWVVHARVPGCHGEPLDGALAKIEEWLAGRSLEEVSCRVGGQPYELYARKVA